MSAFEREMLALNKKHMDARIENERSVCDAEKEILKVKHEAELVRLELFKKMLSDTTSVNIFN